MAVLPAERAGESGVYRNIASKDKLMTFLEDDITTLYEAFACVTSGREKPAVPTFAFLSDAPGAPASASPTTSILDGVWVRVHTNGCPTSSPRPVLLTLGLASVRSDSFLSGRLFPLGDFLLLALEYFCESVGFSCSLSVCLTHLTFPISSTYFELEKFPS